MESITAVRDKWFNNDTLIHSERIGALESVPRRTCIQSNRNDVPSASAQEYYK